MAGLDSINHLRGDDLIAAYKERYGDKTLLAFSRGKDSVAVALALRDKIEVMPFHYDDLPGLEFVRPTAGNWTPIWDWSKQKLLDTIEKSGISLPPDYTFLPRSFDGFSYLFLMPLKERYPRDYQRVLEWFPLAEAEILRYQIHQRLNS